MIDDKVIAVFTNLLLSCWHSRLSSVKTWHLTKLFLIKARFIWLECERILLLKWVNIEWRWLFLSLLGILGLMIVFKSNEEVLSDILNFALSHIIIVVEIIVIV